MKGNNLGELEELVLLMVASLDEEAYAVAVREELEKSASRVVNISAVHSSLYRLEDKGFLTSEFGGATSKRGGKKKRLFKVTSAGYAILKEAKETKEQIWSNIPQLSFSTI
ncbi:MAG: PadR family transcriptional regulator [Imperialibacter sp.]|uniref:PadR family transcriptional regulator n=1 Tax=Imperialibacter sp. TaxID=2038411 RepID=UPI003A89D65A